MTVAVTITVLVGLLALSLDLGRMYNLSTELDNAADAYALAGASQLDKTPGSCTRAITAAVDASLRNQETFASNTAGPITIDGATNLANRNIRFLSEIVKDAQGRVTGNYITASMPVCDANADFIEVTIDTDAANMLYQVDFFLAGVLKGPLKANPSGYAVAGVGRVFCGVAPIMMCEFPGNLTYADVVADPAGQRGRGIWLRSGNPGVQWGGGNFGFLSLDGPSGGGANQLRDALGMVNPPLLCLSLEDLETEPGNNSGARHGFNTRFDIYHGPASGLVSNNQFQPAADTVKGLVRQGCNLSGWASPGTPYNGPGTMPSPVPADAAMPLPMDNCAYASGGGGCMANSNLGRLGDGVWDFATYLAVNHPGTSMAAAMSEIIPSATPGSAFGRADGVTRYDVYRWEVGYPNINTYGAGNYGTVDPVLHRLVDNIGATPPLPQPLGPGTAPATPQTAEYGGPQCFTGTMGSAGSVQVNQDRRTIRIAMVDCQAQTIQGETSGISANGFVDVFVTTPWRTNGSQHEIYVELIGPANNQGINQPLAKQIVQLYE